MTRTMYERDSQGLSRLLDKRILIVGDSLLLDLRREGNVMTLGAKVLL
jgi:hypothetical protein